jgi:hypothetical protein
VRSLCPEIAPGFNGIDYFGGTPDGTLAPRLGGLAPGGCGGSVAQQEISVVLGGPHPGIGLRLRLLWVGAKYCRTGRFRRGDSD